tara:strand:+ start:1236 stop:1658 length:423 start_codon:yes stop_codon:yes gene_type:complete
MENYAEAVESLDVAKKQKVTIDSKIKKLTREVLEHQEAQASVLLLSNQGGERTVQGVTFEVKRNYEWDQDQIEAALLLLKDEDSLPFLTRLWKVNMSKYKDWGMLNPKNAQIFSNALATKLGNPTVKKIDLDKFNSKEES